MYLYILSLGEMYVFIYLFTYLLISCSVKCHLMMPLFFCPSSVAVIDREEAPLFFLKWTVVLSQLLFQCWIPLCSFSQAEIYQVEDLPHGGLFLRAASLRDAAPPYPLQARGEG